MKIESIDVSVSDELIKGITDFHGHLGPFIILGLKAGLLANAVLGKDYFKTTVIVMADPSPPSSCIVDGIQFVTGCTMGKGNIKLRKSKHVSVTFTKNHKRLRLKLTNRILNSIKDITSEEESRKASFNLLNKPLSELFTVAQ
jgi:formylmethanofuran dehydrogenase subunit E